MVAKIKDILLIGLPLVLWPVSFILLKGIFIYALLGSVFLLALFSLSFYRKQIPWMKVRSTALIAVAGILGAFLLYLIFYVGGYSAALIGIGGMVGNIYQMIYGSVPKMQLILLLVPIAVFEEIYWRGALQSYIKKNSARLGKHSWLVAALFYGLVHIASLNLILVAAALLVGLVTSVMADRYGIMSSIITHVIWIEAIVVFLPVMIK